MSTLISLQPEFMLGIGIGLSAVGVIIWNIPSLQKKKFDLRYSRILEFRKIGDEDRASSLEAATDMIIYRTSFSGRLIFSAGALAVIAGVWTAL